MKDLAFSYNPNLKDPKIPTPMKGVKLPEIRGTATFVQSEKSLILDNFGKTVDDSVVDLIGVGLRLKSDFDDFKRLHDDNLGPT